MTGSPDMSAENIRRTRVCWMRITWYLCELYDQPRVALFLKIRLVKELFNDWGGRVYYGSVPEEVTKTVPSGDRTT